MARTKGTVRPPSYPIYSVVRYQPFRRPDDSRDRVFSPMGTWLHKQPNSPRIVQGDLIEEMKKIRKYYPKKISALKQITLAYNVEGFDEESKEIYCQIISKYKKDFFRYFCLDFDQEVSCPLSLFRKSFHKIRVLHVLSRDEGFPEDCGHFPQILKHNKLLSQIQVNTNKYSGRPDLRWLKYLPNLRKLQLNTIPDESSDDWKRSISKVELLTIFGHMEEENFEEFVQGISQLNSLKKVNFELKISDNKLLERFPFEDFKTRNIAYDLRITAEDDAKSKSKSKNIDLAALAQTDFLGLSCLKGDSETFRLHNPFQIASVDFQRQSKNLFFLEGVNQSCFDALLKNCHKITTLDLLLSQGGQQLSLPSLDHLTKLRHLSLKICGHDDNFDEWKTLTNYAGKHNNLSYLSLCFKSGKITKKNFGKIGRFLDALKGSLTTLFLSFIGGDTVEEEALKSFSTKISNLQKLRSLYLDRLSLIELVKICDLEELRLNLSEDSEITTKALESIFKEATKLTKLSLQVGSFEESLNFSKAFSNLEMLKDLELIVNNFSQENWKALVKALPKFNNLEILKVASKEEDDGFSLVRENTQLQIQELIKNHPNLKLVALGRLLDEDEALIIAVEKKYLYNIDTFLCRFKQGVLENLVDYKISYV